MFPLVLVHMSKFIDWVYFSTSNNSVHLLLLGGWCSFWDIFGFPVIIFPQNEAQRYL